ncbi:MAG: isoprenylcysteine carboxylmethyltransferase family protein [Nanoarchaeota archaeon]|nr:isoprenylcysteine carboxylmethyltransferase family protein [Nanoarchaeota archaeon]
MKKKKSNISRLKLKVVFLVPLSVLATGLFLFLPAGSLSYWNAWLLMAALFIPYIFAIIYFLKKDPKLLERRMRFKEKEAQQKIIVKLASFFVLIGFLIPGFDYRYGWSDIPKNLALFSAAIVFLGYLIIFFVFNENSYAARTIRVEKSQKVITTGPYSIVRHPMYVGVILMYLFIPLTLGSYYALIFFVPPVILIIFRILNEEKVLLKGLKGYKAYTKKVKYRLIPGIW